MQAKKNKKLHRERPKPRIQSLIPSFLRVHANNPDIIFKCVSTGETVLYQINKEAIPDKAEPKVKETST